MGKTALTIKDIAEMSGVSIGTVDRVLHNRGNVSKKSLEKVNAVLAGIDYEPCAIAKALSSRKKNIIIGVTYPEIECAFWNEVKIGIAAAEHFLEPYGVSIVVRTSADYNPEGQKAAIKELVSLGVSGIILGAVENFSLKGVEDYIPENIPFATVINKTTSPRALFHVGPDDLRIGELAARLINLFSSSSKVNTVIISSNGQFIGSQLRIAGFISKATQELGNLNITQTILADGITDNELDGDIYAKVMDTLVRYPNTNAFYIMNGIFDGAARAIRDSGRGDIILVAHESTKNLKEYLEKGIVKATIYQHPAKQMWIAIKLFYKYLVEGRLGGNSFITESSIIIKESYPFVLMAENDFI